MYNTQIKNNETIWLKTREFLRGKELRFTISFILSILIYLLIFYGSRYVPLFTTGPDFSSYNIKVKLREESPTIVEPVEESVSTSLSTRPISFRKFVEEILPPTEMPEPLPSMSSQKEDLAKQAGTESLSRDTEPLPPEEVLQKVEEQILMIEKETAQDSVEVVRRVLPPTEETILTNGESPTFSISENMPTAEGISAKPSTLPSTLGMYPTTPTERNETEGATAPVVSIPELEPIEPPIPLEQTVEEEILQQPIIEETKKEKENRPYEFWDDLLELQLKTYFTDNNTQGFFQLNIVPKKDAKITPLPKQVAFIIDSSASIGQRKLDQTIKGIREAIQQLREEDLFNIILFRERATFFSDGYIQANTANKNSALKYLQQIPSTGQTDVYTSVRQLVQVPPTSGLPNILWLYSDGKSTIGLRDTRMIIANLTMENQGGYEIFTLGGGNTVDRYLLELLAYLNKGFSVIKDNIDQISTSIPQAFAKVQNPILIDVKMDFGSIPREEIYPFVLPDFYQALPVTIYGKFNPQEHKNFVFRLQGVASGKRKEVIFRADFAESEKGDIEIARRWAFHKAFYIISKIVREGEKPELIQILKELKEKYNIKTTYTP
ncbi:MAG: VWA domain-containing protein [Candidatus Hydrogenedens sp.]|nr:VWA domain-containing protein [Candidatus Hydrogenedens sp.]